MNTPLAQQLALSTFTPSTMPQATLEGMFVQREQLLQSIVEDLAASIDSTKQYLMLVGARGMGKTHFVSLVYHRLKQKPKLEDRFLIAWLREELYGINSWLDLIIEILRSLSQEGIDTKAQIDRLVGLPISEREYQAKHMLTEIIGDQTLLIITENIDKLLYGLGDKEQWKFRSFLQETNCCSILATTPKISQDTSKKEKPFFNFFTSIHLPNFTHADAVAMLVKIANLSGNTQLAKFLNTDEGKSRIRALHHLAGGNPRVYVLFVQLITEDMLAALLPAVIDMLDKLTPYYQSRVESLGQSDDQQKIVMYLAREPRAVTVKEIAAQCSISSDNTTSNALKKLTEKGFVIATRKGREAYYEISEVLMRLCLEMKNYRNGDLQLCVDFLRIWFRPNERQKYLERLEADGNLEHAKYVQMSLESSKSDPVLIACKHDLQKSLDGGDANTALQVWRELVINNKVCELEDRRIVELISSGKLADAIIRIEVLLEEESAEEMYLKALSLYESKQWQQSIEIFNIVVKLQPNNHEAWIKRGQSLYFLGKFSEEIESYDRALEINPNDSRVWNRRGATLDDLGMYQEAIDSYDHALKLNPDYAYAWHNRGNSLGNIGKYEEAITNYNYALKINPDNAGAWKHRGNSLHSIGRYEEAIASYDRSLELKPDDTIWDKQEIVSLNLNRYEAEIWYSRGYALDQLGRYEEAIASYDRNLELSSDNYAVLYRRGIALLNLNRYEAAITNYNRMIELNPENYTAWNSLGFALLNLDRYEAAITSYDHSLQLNPDNDTAWNGRGIALRKLGRYEEAIASYDRSLELKPDNDEVWHNKGWAFYKWGKYQEALNAYQQAINIKPDHGSWHDIGFVLFHIGKYDEALAAWKESFNIISKLKPSDTSDLIQEFLDEQLLPKFQQPAVRDILPQILTIYTTAQVLPELGVALTRNLKAIQSPTISNYTATEWLKMWQELGKPHPELALALRMLEAGIKYKQNPTDDRIFLSLPQEMRPLLREALGLEQ
jgi:tetratricopeptide (TPR) repeat protein